MARRKVLSDEQIARLAPRSSAYPDPELAGHYIRVRPSGKRVFCVVVRDPNGKQVWQTIGDTVTHTIEAARAEAAEKIKAIKSGASRAGVETFEAVATEWLKRHVDAKGLISASEVRSYLARVLLPAWSGREFASIKRSDIAKLLDHVEDASGPVAADYVLSVIRGICTWYATRNDDYNSPIVRGMRRSNPKENARARILDDDELRTLWGAANGTFGAFVRVALLTGQRREKVLAMRWDDISADGEWHIPTAKREKSTAGSLVLPQAAIDIIQAQPRFVRNAHVFAGRGSNPIAGISKRKAQFDKQAGIAQNWTVHDLRRTAKSLMVRAGIRPDISERVLGHAIQGVEGTYDRHSYREEKAHALRALAGLIENILRPEAATVTRLRG